MRHRQHLENKLAFCLIGSALSLFGTYLIYERAILPIISGVTEDRAGLTSMAQEPILFWMSVTLFGAIGIMLSSFGAWALWNVFKTPKQ